MPCPHNEITIVQRSQRQSAVAAAAYQSGEKLFCEYDITPQWKEELGENWQQIYDTYLHTISPYCSFSKEIRLALTNS